MDTAYLEKIDLPTDPLTAGDVAGGFQMFVARSIADSIHGVFSIRHL